MSATPKPPNTTYGPLVVDLNGDVGEGCPWDAALIPLLSSANVACGGHAGDPNLMARTLAFCANHGIGLGPTLGTRTKTVSGGSSTVGTFRRSSSKSTRNCQSMRLLVRGRICHPATSSGTAPLQPRGPRPNPGQCPVWAGSRENPPSAPFGSSAQRSGRCRGRTQPGF